MGQCHCSRGFATLQRSSWSSTWTDTSKEWPDTTDDARLVKVPCPDEPPLRWSPLLLVLAIPTDVLGQRVPVPRVDQPLEDVRIDPLLEPAHRPVGHGRVELAVEQPAQGRDFLPVEHEVI